jgi:hypothetical protein
VCEIALGEQLAGYLDLRLAGPLIDELVEV